MRAPSVFACLPGLTPQCLLQNFDKHNSLLGYDDDAVLPPAPPPREVFPNEVRSLRPVPEFLAKLLLSRKERDDSTDTCFEDSRIWTPRAQFVAHCKGRSATSQFLASRSIQS